LKYSALSKHGGHIVNEGFDYYVDRQSDCEAIIHAMKCRKLNRIAFNNSEDLRRKMDKKMNPLIALPGAPGSGKSTFLVHLPLSKEYSEYCGEAVDPVVSTLTFNGGMFETSANHIGILGLRIFYGAMIGMGAIEWESLTWIDFVDKIANVCSEKKFESVLTASMAIRLLKNVFGADRPVLILIDELVKAPLGSQAEIMGEIGGLLDVYDDVDIVVSSLAPTFITDLVRARPLKFVVMHSLQESDLGRFECLEWANTLIDEITSAGVVLDDNVKAMLQNSYLLLSGFPRGLENLVTEFQKRKYWVDIVHYLITSPATKISLPILLLKITRGFVRAVYEGDDSQPTMVSEPDLGAINKEALITCLFSAPAVFSVNDPTFRDMVNTGDVLIARQLSHTKFTPYMRAMDVLSYLDTMLCSDFSNEGLGRILGAKLAAARSILDGMFTCSRISLWFEKIITLTIVSRSLDRFTLDSTGLEVPNSIADILGIVGSPLLDSISHENGFVVTLNCSQATCQRS